jgi:hypothetical protein
MELFLSMLRRLRGVIGMGLTWGTVCAALGAPLGLVVGVVSPEQLDGGEGPLLFARCARNRRSYFRRWIRADGVARRARSHDSRHLTCSRGGVGDARRRRDSAADIRRQQSGFLDLPTRRAPRDVHRADREESGASFSRARAESREVTRVTRRGPRRVNIPKRKRPKKAKKGTAPSRQSRQFAHRGQRTWVVAKTEETRQPARALSGMLNESLCAPV